MASKQQLAAKAAAIEKRLAALDGPEWDSASSEDEAPAKPPPPAKPSKKAEKRARAAEAAAAASRVIYVGHVPHGFYEAQMRGFFSQFGDVTNLRLSRSKRTGNSKGYAFVEFEDADVARIAARAMDKYLMHGKQLVAHVAPLELATKPSLFRGSDKPFKKRVGGREHHARRGDDPAPNAARLLGRERAKRARLAESFPGYDFPGYAAAAAAGYASAGPPAKKRAGGGSAAAPPPPPPPPGSKKKKKKKPAAGAGARINLP